MLLRHLPFIWEVPTMDDYCHGVAFIVEGDTEKVFYLSLLKYYCSKHTGVSLCGEQDPETGAKFYCLHLENGAIVLIKIFVAGTTIAHVSNSGSWFIKRCYQAHKPLNWFVFLCYDTDDYKENISKFYEDDWAELRKTLRKGRPREIIDLAAAADIEDLMLLDCDSIFSFLEMEPVAIPQGSKGKRKMKRLFRLKGPAFAYHEGERALPLIQSLDFERIIMTSPIPLQDVDRICFNSYSQIRDAEK